MVRKLVPVEMLRPLPIYVATLLQQSKKEARHSQGWHCLHQETATENKR